MKKKIMGLVMGIMLIGVNLFAADGDVIVNGNVGVGTTNPQAKLDVNGAIRTAAGQNFKIRFGSGSQNVNIAAGSGGNYGPFNFGYTFSSTPIVIISGTSYGSYRQALNPSATDKTTTGFMLRLFNTHPSGTATGTYTFDWIAIGE